MPLDYEIDGYLCAADATIDQIHPRKDILLVRRIPDEEVLASGLVIPAMARDSKTGVRIGEVLKCGPGDTVGQFGTTSDGKRLVETIPMECKPGDRVAYMRCPDNDVNIGGVDCVLLREEQHVLAILNKPICGRGDCRAPAVALHVCPYAEEINNDSTTKCGCCASCERECAMDI
jgi:co-chaperonin GroES (HSP10)